MNDYIHEEISPGILIEIPQPNIDLTSKSPYVFKLTADSLVITKDTQMHKPQNREGSKSGKAGQCADLSVSFIWSTKKINKSIQLYTTYFLFLQLVLSRTDLTTDILIILLVLHYFLPPTMFNFSVTRHFDKDQLRFQMSYSLGWTWIVA